jgi:hypothetical protein
VDTDPHRDRPPFDRREPAMNHDHRSLATVIRDALITGMITATSSTTIAALLTHILR